MAIYHLNISVVSRGRGQRVVAAAAAQSASRLRDEYYGVVHNHSRRAGVEFREILAPADVPAWVFDREQLWNRVESAERRRDAQLARAVDISLPIELTHEQRIDLLREYTRSQFVAQGMIADLSVRRTRADNPNASVLLTLRAAMPEGFGLKVRHWNRKANLLAWRAAWADCTNLHLARAGHRARIDHRTLEAQQVDLTPARRIGAARGAKSPDHLLQRAAEQRHIARDNGAAITADPAIAIRALARRQDTFSIDELAGFLASRTDGVDQLQAALAAVRSSTELVPLGDMGAADCRFASKDRLEAEKSLQRRATTLRNRRRARKSDGADPTLEWDRVPVSLHAACRYAMSPGDLKALALPSGENRGFLDAMRPWWEAHGARVRLALPVSSDTELGPEDIVVVERVEMIELKMLESALAAVERARARIVLLADAERLAAMGARSAAYTCIDRDMATPRQEFP